MSTMTPISEVELPRELVLASAGTGKTFRIASRIIGLLAAGTPPDSIFASTFTRKAAGEILDRVLKRIAEAALDEEAAAKLVDDTFITGTAQFEGSSSDWLNLLERVIRGLHRINISTLDAFFVRAVGSFADDLALPPGWRIAEQPVLERVQSEALESLLTASNADPDEVIELIRGVSGTDAGRSIHNSILERAAELIDLHHSLDPDVEGHWTGFDAIATDDPEGFDKLRMELARKFAEYPTPLTKSNTPRKNFGNRLQEAAVALETGDWRTLIDSPLCKAARTEERKFDREQIADDLYEMYDLSCGLARIAIARRLAAQCRATGRLAAKLAATVDTHQRDSGAYGFSDLTRLMGGPDPLCERLDLYYRLDARTRHILLDEFQDTSLTQWEALQPLVDELLTGHLSERAAVVVADPKQSIYGWRGAEPMLVNNIAELYSFTEDRLSMSYRSSPLVLDFVNRVFTGLSANETFDERPDLQQVAANWETSFEAHTAAKDIPGFVQVSVGPADEPRSQKRPMLCRGAAELAAELHHGSKGATIGVLTRTNSTVARIMLELKRLGVDASEEGGNALTDSAAVAAMLALLRLADHPGNRIARYHVAKTPLGEAVDFVDYEDDTAALRLSERIRRRLLYDGYGHTLSVLSRKVAPSCGDRDRRRLAQLVELGFEYDPDASLRASDFCDVVETKRVEDPKSADVRVMTVHQSKGLEFDIVILPELDASMAPKPGQTLAYRSTEGGRVVRAFPYVGETERSLFPDLSELHAAAEQATAAAFRDGLSGLYVAMTRARHAMHILIKPDGKSGMGKALSGARIVRHALGATETVREGDVLYQEGDPNWYERNKTPAADHAYTVDSEDMGDVGDVRDVSSTGGLAGPVAGSSVNGGELIQLLDRPRTRLLPRRAPSDLAGSGRSVNLGLLLNLDDTHTSEGTLIHAWMEQIGWLEDGIPDDDELAQIARSLGVTDVARTAASIRKFRSWLAVPAVRKALEKATYPAGSTVESEVAFAFRTGNALMEGFIDRLVHVREGGRVTGAIVIDYKTDALDEGDEAVLRSRLEYYRPQLDAYRQAVAAGYKIPLSTVDAQLVFLDAGRVLSVE